MTAALTDVERWTPVPAGVWGALRAFIEPYVGCSFTVPGDPVPKGRPRFGKGCVITPKRTLRAERQVREAFREAMPGWQAEPDRTYGMLVEFRTAAGSSVDVDNAVKLVADALNRVFYEDDVQVGDEYLHLVRGQGEPGVEVWLFAVEPNGTRPTRLCECGTRYRGVEKMCVECRRRRAVVNSLLAEDDAAEAAERLRRDRALVFSFIVASMIGTNRSPTIAAITKHVNSVRSVRAGEPAVSEHRIRTVISTLTADGYLNYTDRKFQILKPLGGSTC